MIKTELAQQLASSEGLPLSTALKAVDGLLRVITQTLASGQAITLRGFGTLTPVTRRQRNALHFKTKKPITIPAHTSVKLRISKQLIKLLNDDTLV